MERKTKTRQKKTEERTENYLVGRFSKVSSLNLAKV